MRERSKEKKSDLSILFVHLKKYYNKLLGDNLTCYRDDTCS